MKKKIAIIGSGIAGLTSAYYLNEKHDITVFEAEEHIGGHTHTTSVEYNGEKARIDTGFIVFNERTYPNFIQLMDSIGVQYQPTEMSFSVRNDAIDLEYNGHTLSTLFTQKKNLLRLFFYSMLYDIVRFNKAVRSQKNSHMTIGEYLVQEKYSETFTNNYLLPMVSAIWSMGLESCMQFPLQFFARFFENHGLLDIIDRPQWYTIKDGSSSYLAPLTAGFKEKIHTSTPINSIRRTDDGVILKNKDGCQHFDEVILACHGDQALALLSDPHPLETDIMQNFQCSSNSVIVHTDTSVLPRRRGNWASWNYHMVDAETEKTTLTYNMNILQRLNLQNTYLVTLNQPVDEKYTLKKYTYMHPIFTQEAISAQQRWQEISGVRNTHYCGAYWYNGFHEDGVRSGMRVAKTLEEER